MAKVIYTGYIMEGEFEGIKCLVFNFDEGGSARVESLAEEFCHHPRVKLTIEDIREPKERAEDWVARVSAVSLQTYRGIGVVPQRTMAAPI